MGVAGGLVPSPSALVVLLSAIALGRTAFGVLLVVAYGLGMAATLTAAGLLLVHVRDRYADRALTRTGRARTLARRWAAVSPYATAILVFVVGVGLALRSLGAR
jgi:nickel/cobalt transporter (NicO) family protein